MEGIIGSLVEQIIVMFVLMALGFVLRRVKFVTEQGTAQLSDLVLYVANPIIIMQSLMMPFDPVKLGYAGYCAVVTVIIAVIAIAISRGVWRDRRRIAQFGVIFSNCGFLGIPLVQGMIGDEYVFYLSCCNACLVAFMWTYGIWLVTDDVKQISIKKIVLNPCIIALVLGFICFLTSYEPPVVVMDIFDDLANLNTGLVMIVLGSYLAGADIRSLLKHRLIYLVSALRLLAIPAIALAILVFVPLVPLEVALAVIIALATPSAAVTAMFAAKFGRDYRLGAGIVAITTLFSLVTMPLLVIAAEMLL